MTPITFIVKGVKSPTSQTLVSTEAAAGTPILDVALQAGIPLEHACERCCACATCHVILEAGGANIPPASEREEDMLDHAFGVTLGSRLSCQARVGTAPLKVVIPKYSLNPVKLAHFTASLASIEKDTQKRDKDPLFKLAHPEALTWDQAEAIAFQLEESLGSRYPQPEQIRFTELRDLVCDLKPFKGNPEHCSEAKLERILSHWLSLKEGTGML